MISHLSSSLSQSLATLQHAMIMTPTTPKMTPIMKQAIFILIQTDSSLDLYFLTPEAHSETVTSLHTGRISYICFSSFFLTVHALTVRTVIISIVNVHH